VDPCTHKDKHRRQSWGIGGRDPQILSWVSWGFQGVVRGVVNESQKNYSLFCTESTLESILFIRKREKLAQNVGAKGENVNI